MHHARRQQGGHAIEATAAAPAPPGTCASQGARRSPQWQARRGDERFDLPRPSVHHPRLERVYGVGQAAVVLPPSPRQRPAAQGGAVAAVCCRPRVGGAVGHEEPGIYVAHWVVDRGCEAWERRGVRRQRGWAAHRLPGGARPSKHAPGNLLITCGARMEGVGRGLLQAEGGRLFCSLRGAGQHVGGGCKGPEGGCTGEKDGNQAEQSGGVSASFMAAPDECCFIRVTPGHTPLALSWFLGFLPPVPVRHRGLAEGQADTCHSHTCRRERDRRPHIRPCALIGHITVCRRSMISALTCQAPRPASAGQVQLCSSSPHHVGSLPSCRGNRRLPNLTAARLHGCGSFT